MTSDQIQYIMHERETWQRKLDSIQQENIWMKTRLAETIKKDIDNNLLEQVEYFQTQFLDKDAIIALIRCDIAGENKSNGSGLNNKAVSRHEKLRKDMELMEKEFSRLKTDFNSYLLHAQ